jgi:hypothetical protein
LGIPFLAKPGIATMETDASEFIVDPDDPRELIFMADTP